MKCPCCNREMKTTENQTKKLIFQRIVDGFIIVLISVFILSLYENDWATVHISNGNMFAIDFDMFGAYYVLVCTLFIAPALPIFLKILSQKRIMYRYTDEKQMPTKLRRFLKIIFLSFIVLLCSIMFADKYTRVEFHNDGRIIKYNRQNQVVNKYEKSDVDFVELRTNNSFPGRTVTHWPEAVVYVKDNKFILTENDFIAPESLAYDETERSLYGLKKVKEVFSDKIKIGPENLDTLLEVEYMNYTQEQAEELCEIFEVDAEKISLWLEEAWGIVLETESE